MGYSQGPTFPKAADHEAGGGAPAPQITDGAQSVSVIETTLNVRGMDAEGEALERWTLQGEHWVQKEIRDLSERSFCHLPFPTKNSYGCPHLTGRTLRDRGALTLS